jgi:hypothetical protein
MKSKLLQKVNCGVNELREVVNGQQEHTEGSSMPWRARENPPGRVSPPVEALDHKDSPDHLHRNQLPNHETAFNFHTSQADHRDRGKRLRLPSCLLIETASNDAPLIPLRRARGGSDVG